MRAAHCACAATWKTFRHESNRYAELGLADARGVLQHGLEHRLNSPGDELMTLNTSDVAVCCSSDSRSSLSSRVSRWR